MNALVHQTKELWEQDDLPEGLLWIADLSPRHQRLFYADVQHEWGRYCATQDDASLIRFLEDWRATADVDKDRSLSTDLLEPKDESEYSEWKAAS